MPSSWPHMVQKWYSRRVRISFIAKLYQLSSFCFFSCSFPHLMLLATPIFPGFYSLYTLLVEFIRFSSWNLLHLPTFFPGFRRAFSRFIQLIVVLLRMELKCSVVWFDGVNFPFDCNLLVRWATFCVPLVGNDPAKNWPNSIRMERQRKRKNYGIGK